MTVGELIKKLQEFDPAYRVFVESDGHWYPVAEVQPPGGHDFDRDVVTLS